mmetsp:Transcript_25431/g.46169  ORF Transcript_25431/g.46169 Transcript_25431/m.46169 type:complete len:357 (-) Transcript_25431:100-1170(-)
MAKSKATEQWLAFLAAETAVLLLLQLLFGFLGKSLSLIADSPHTGADLVSYSLNYYMERWKSTSEQAKHRRQLDLYGCLFSTFMLCLATSWAACEAFKRLVSTGTSDVDSLGPCLMSFSILSTVFNVLTLALYYRGRCCRNEISEPPPDPQVPDPPDLEVPDLPSSEAVNEVPPPAPEANFSFPRRARRGRDRRGLNLKADFASPECPPECQALNCHHYEGDERNDFMTAVHKLVHPGCVGHSHTSKSDLDIQTASVNLNVKSAVLHLVTDILRGITILVVAVLIQTKAVADPGKADAVCALLVSILVGLGSIELFRRAGTLLLEGWQSNDSMSDSKSGSSSNQTSASSSESVELS